jgi:hypothetical protein
MKTDTDLEALTTETVLALYERWFGKLEQPARERIATAALANGWDRTWATAA